jgi:hypothetical protein
MTIMSAQYTRALCPASAPTTAPSFSVIVLPLLRLVLALVLNGLASFGGARHLGTVRRWCISNSTSRGDCNRGLQLVTGVRRVYVAHPDCTRHERCCLRCSSATNRCPTQWNCDGLPWQRSQVKKGLRTDERFFSGIQLGLGA